MESSDIRQIVRENYGQIAIKGSSCCGGGSANELSSRIGYSEADLASAPEGANLGLGCGNPVALASLQPGETVLDLGSGAGFDCFLAAEEVGNTGHVIGVDMTPEMLARARANAQKGPYSNVEFRLGEIENLPVADASVDVIISNCVINLASDKSQVFREAYRVLKPGGRLMVSDIVLEKELPLSVKNSVDAYVGCVAGAMLKNDYLKEIEAAGFSTPELAGETAFHTDGLCQDPVVASAAEEHGIAENELQGLAQTVVSLKVKALKPV